MIYQRRNCMNGSGQKLGLELFDTFGTFDICSLFDYVGYFFQNPTQCKF